MIARRPLEPNKEQPLKISSSLHRISRNYGLEGAKKNDRKCFFLFKFPKCLLFEKVQLVVLYTYF